MSMSGSSDQFVVRDIFTTHSLHIIYGPSGAGVSTFLFQTMGDWSRGQDVLGHQSLALPYALISAVQTKAEMRAHFRQLGMDPSQIPHLSLLEAGNAEDRTVEGALHVARNVCSHLRVLFIDGLAGLCPGNINIYREAAQYLSRVRQLCHQQDITIIGTVPCGKSEDDTGVRHRPIGSVAWSQYSGTKICIEFVDAQKLNNPERMVHILPRGSEPITQRYAFDPDTHRLEPCGEVNPSADEALNEWLRRQSSNQEISIADIILAGAQLGASRATVYRWIKQCVELGLLLAGKRGVYTPASAPIQN